MSEIIDCIVFGSCRFTGTNPERGAPGHLVLGGVLNDDAQVQSLEAQKERKRVPHDVHMYAPLTTPTRVRHTGMIKSTKGTQNKED